MPGWHGAAPKMKRCMVSVKVVRTHGTTHNPMNKGSSSCASALPSPWVRG